MAKTKETYQVYIKQNHEDEYGIHFVDFYFEDVMYLMEVVKKTTWVLTFSKNKIENEET
jgi:predicted house-cleaning noncanonical NTP pyrophosphatase (MazG superfamily)